MKRSIKEATRSRTERPDFFDFSRHPKPTHELAAQAVTREQLSCLFEQLDRADEMFADDNRQAVLAAVGAVVSFLTSTPHGDTGRFSRPLELLIAELRDRKSLAKDRIVPPSGSGAGGIFSGRNKHYVKAAAAYAVEFMNAETAASIPEASKVIADVLAESSFRFGAKRSDKWKAIQAWRKEYQRQRSTTTDHAGIERAANFYRKLVANPPVKTVRNAENDRAAILHWLKALVARAGNGSVV